MTIYEIILMFINLIVPLLLIYCAITNNHKVTLSFLTVYAVLSILSVLFSCEFDIFRNLTENILFGFINFFVIVLFVIIAYVCILLPKTLKWAKYLFLVPIIFMLLIFVVKTNSLPHRTYSGSYRTSDFFEILGFAFLSLSIGSFKK